MKARIILKYKKFAGLIAQTEQSHTQYVIILSFSAQYCRNTVIFISYNERDTTT